MNRVQFQSGISLPAFYRQFGTEEQCTKALELARWPGGFRCPHCQHANYYLIQACGILLDLSTQSQFPFK